MAEPFSICSMAEASFLSAPRRFIGMATVSNTAPPGAGAVRIDAEGSAGRNATSTKFCGFGAGEARVVWKLAKIEDFVTTLKPSADRAANSGSGWGKYLRTGLSRIEVFISVLICGFGTRKGAECAAEEIAEKNMAPKNMAFILLLLFPMSGLPYYGKTSKWT
ncbi:hypothetical protein [Rhizobium terrae]|uniref:hypothetical protein n=1 Tax=Rhizobium terrae TaxID=2171756 RepID=UPI001D02B732|nr:hypothetical protein [Rhizobium terrae]